MVCRAHTCGANPPAPAALPPARADGNAIDDAAGPGGVGAAADGRPRPESADGSISTTPVTASKPATSAPMRNHRDRPAHRRPAVTGTGSTAGSSVIGNAAAGGWSLSP